MSINLRLPEGRFKVEQATIRNQEISQFCIAYQSLCPFSPSRTNPPTSDVSRTTKGEGGATKAKDGKNTGENGGERGKEATA